MKVNYAVCSEEQHKFGSLMNFHEDELHLSQHLLIIASPTDPLALQRHLHHVEQLLEDLNSHFFILMNRN